MWAASYCRGAVLCRVRTQNFHSRTLLRQLNAQPEDQHSASSAGRLHEFVQDVAAERAHVDTLFVFVFKVQDFKSGRMEFLNAS